MKVIAAPVLRPFTLRAGLAALPVLSVGLLCPVPSLVLALRRRDRADWWAFGFFSAVLVAWIADLRLTPEVTHGWEFGADLVLVLLSMVGASLHVWRAWPQADEGR
ncbi:hypothetical protein ACL02U_25235 [Streptomyces sp. MS06]|uniref:hypothetical protein n=1 Tax=Streptomyces sp. MS06 TaxID=3385974 RepID=UPI0039A2FDB6